jgi:hypothetical protein
LDDDWGAECLPPSSNPACEKARIRQLGRAAHYIAGVILAAAIHRRRLEQKKTTQLSGGWSGTFK